MSALRELLAQFTIDVDDRALQRGVKSVESFVGTLRQAAGAAAGVFAVREIAGWIDHQIEAAARVKDLSQRLDVAAQDIRAFGLVAGSAGVDLEGAAHSVGHLYRAIGEARQGSKEASQALALVGIKGLQAGAQGKPLAELLGDVADGLQKLPDKYARTQVAMQLFGRQGQQLLPILMQGRQHIQELTEDAEKLGNGLGEDFYTNAQKARFEMQRADFAWQSFRDRLTNAVLPSVVDLLRFFEKTGVAMVDLDRHTYIVQTGLAALGTIAAATGIAVLAPFAPEIAAATVLAAGIGTVYLAFDDIYTLMKGGRSIVGGVLDDFLGFDGATKAVLYLNAALHDTWDLLKDVAGIVGHVIGEVGDVTVDAAKAAFYREQGNQQGMDKALSDLAADNARHGQGVIDILTGGGKKRGIFDRVEDVSTMLDAGISPSALFGYDHNGAEGPSAARRRHLASLPPAEREKELARDRGVDRVVQGLGFGGFDQAPIRAWLAEHPTVTPPSVPVPGPAGGRAAPAEQHIAVTVPVTVQAPRGTQPRAFGEEVGKGAAAPMTTALRNALSTQVQP